MKDKALEYVTADSIGNSYYDICSWQQLQYSHDKRNHFDILSLHKLDRLKHYGLHFAKYAGRLARGNSESKTVEETCVDSLLVSLSSANTLHQQLEIIPTKYRARENQPTATQILEYTSLAGAYCDACEKIDHLEDFLLMAKNSNVDLFNLSLNLLQLMSSDVETLLTNRRTQLAERQFYIGSDNGILE